MSDIIRVGYISNVNYAEGTAQVVYKGDGSYIRYDKESKQLDIVSDSVHMEGLSVSGNLSVSGSINAGSITTGGNVHIKGNLTVDGSYPK